MTAADFEQVAEITRYGAQRRQEWMQRLQANSDMATSAALAAHGASDHDVITAGQGGLYGSATPQDMGAAVAARAATVGQDYGQGRALERRGGTFDHANDGPAPGRYDLTSASAPPGYQRTDHPLKHLNEGRS